MNRTGLIIGLIVCTLLAVSCSPSQLKPYRTTGSVCEKFFSPDGKSPVSQLYQRAASDTCVAYLPAFDQSGWIESKLNSRKVRGERTVSIGCVNCPAGSRECDQPGVCTSCTSLLLNFDFTKIQEDGQIVAAYVALFAPGNPEPLENAIVEGRVNIGGDMAVVADAPIISGPWVMYDITPFACRAVFERRNSASFEISLPCGTGETAAVATRAFSADVEPTLVIEYR